MTIFDLMADPAKRDTALRVTQIAAAMMHVEGSYSVKSVGFRTCNPGNLMSGQNHLVFKSISEGYVALLNDIAHHVGEPLQDFLYQYAPPGENDSLMYVHVVSTLCGIAYGEAI